MLVGGVTCPCCMSHVIQASRFSRALSEKIPIKTELEALNTSPVFCNHHGTNILYQFNSTSFSKLDTLTGISRASDVARFSYTADT